VGKRRRALRDVILDDVLVQSDAERKVAILRVLHVVGKDRERFSRRKDDVLSWAEPHLAGAYDRVERLQ
jgi:hypothetical protein